MRYELFSYYGECNPYDITEDDCIIESFTAKDDFHAYLMIFMLVHENLGYDEYSEYNLYDPKEVEECIEYLKERYKEDEITLDWLRYKLQTIDRYAPWRAPTVIFDIKRGNRIIERFDDIPSNIKKCNCTHIRSK